MILAMFRGAGRIALWLATMAFLTAVGLFVVGSYLLAWPILRKSPRERRVKATVDFASSGMTLLTAFSDASIQRMMSEAMDGNGRVDEPADAPEPHES